MEGRTDKRPLRASNVFVDGDRVYSYGYHFELARPLRDKAGKVCGYLLNGDRFSNTTSSHQSSVRNALSGKAQVIIPYSAMEAAGVDLDSVKVLERLHDRWENHKHHSDTFPEGAKWRDETVRWERGTVVETRRVLGASGSFYSPVIRISTAPDGSDQYDWETSHHWLGESLIRAKVRFWDRDSGTHHRWATFLSGFDHQESTPLYFFCEMPYGSKATTVAEAYEALKPDPVKLAEQMGRSWTRQGDIFAVPTRLDRKALVARGARLEKRAPMNAPRPTNLPYILNTNHTATEVAYLPGVTLARGVLYHDPGDRGPDHARRKMGDGKTWHIVVKNTVPIAGRR